MPKFVRKCIIVTEKFIFAVFAVIIYIIVVCAISYKNGILKISFFFYLDLQ